MGMPTSNIISNIYNGAPRYDYATRPEQQMYMAPDGTWYYPMTEADHTLRLVAFVFMLISTIGTCWLVLPLAWMIPMTVVSWRIYKGTRANTVAFDVCSLIFVSVIGGICLLFSSHER